jgi:DNA primase
MLDKILDHLDRVEKTKEGYTALCPFHDDHNPSFYVFDNGGFFCFGCGERGTHRRLAKHLGIDLGTDEGEEEKHIGKFKDYLRERLQIPDDLFYQKIRQLNIYCDQEYIKLPLISPQNEFLGYIKHKPSGKYLNPSKAKIKGVLFGLDIALNLYNVQRIEKKAKKEISSSIYLTEGPFDALGMLGQGIPAAAILGGANNDPKLVYETLLNKGITHVVLAFDNDEQGLEFTRLYMNYFVTRPEIHTDIFLYTGYKDLNEMLQEEGPEGFKKFIKSRLDKPMKTFLNLDETIEAIEQGDPARHNALMRAADFYKSIHPVHRVKIDVNELIEHLGLSLEEWQALFEDLAERKDKERLKNELSRAGRSFLNNLERDPIGAFEKLKQDTDRTIQGLEKRTPVSVDDELDDIVHEIQTEKEGVQLLPQVKNVYIQPYDLVTIGAGTGVGKTTLALNITHNYINAGRRVLFVSYEVGRGQLLAKLLGIHRQEDFREVKYKIKTGTLDIDRQLLKPLSLIADPTFTIEELTRLVGKYQKERPLDLIVVDYDQLCSTEKIFEIEERRVAYISQTLKGVALEYAVPVILLSQLSKEDRLRYSQQKEFDSSIVLKLRVPKDVKEGKNEEKVREYWNASTREIRLDIEKYRDGQPRRDIDLTIDFEKGTIEKIPDKPNL